MSRWRHRLGTELGLQAALQGPLGGPRGSWFAAEGKKRLIPALVRRPLPSSATNYEVDGADGARMVSCATGGKNRPLPGPIWPLLRRCVHLAASREEVAGPKQDTATVTPIS